MGRLRGSTPPTIYSDLVRVSHWTAEEIALEESLKAQTKNIKPDYIASNSFAEVISALDIESEIKVAQVRAVGGRAVNRV